MSSVHVTGHLCVDLVPRWTSEPGIEPGCLLAVGPLGWVLGGATANAGRALAALGHEVSLTARVGGDEVGEITRRLVEREDWDELDLIPSTSASSYTLVVEAAGRDRSFWHHEGANADYVPADVGAPRGTDLVHVGYPSLLPGLWGTGCPELASRLARLRSAGIATSVDLAGVAPDSPAAAVDWSRWLSTVGPACDVLGGSSDDVVSALGAPPPTTLDDLGGLAGMLAAFGPALAVLTGGPMGFAVVAGPGAGDGRFAHLLPVGAEPILVTADTVAEPATTTGTGDVLKAALVDGLLADLPLADAATRAGSITTDYLRTGAVAGSAGLRGLRAPEPARARVTPRAAPDR